MTLLSTHITEIEIAENDNTYIAGTSLTNHATVLYNVYPDYHKFIFTFNNPPLTKELNDASFTWILMLYNDTGGEIFQGVATTTNVTFELINRDSSKIEKMQLWLWDLSDSSYSTLSKTITIYYFDEVTN